MTMPSINGKHSGQAFDHVIIGSGFGGSVSAMRLTEKGYRVLVLERGKRFRDEDFPKSNWNIWKYLWIPALRCFGFFQMSFLNGVLIFHGNGVGGGSLGYANVLMEPGDELFEAPDWRHLANWREVLRPHYATARRMLGVDTNPRLWPADHALKDIADELGMGNTFRHAQVGVFFSNGDTPEGETVPDPYFSGQGPDRASCIHCGGCMVGCRYNAKNSLVKNYLYLAEKWGAQVWPETEVVDIQYLPQGQLDDARFEIVYRRSTAWPVKPQRRVRARNVVVSAGALGTLNLLFRCRDVTGSLPNISPRLGYNVRTNSEELLGVTSKNRQIDFSEGITISSVFQADEVTQIEPVRYPDGSSFIRLMTAPLIDASDNVLVRFAKTAWEALRRPVDFLDAKIFARWARRTTILLVMQTEDTLMRMKLGRNLFTLFRRGLVTQQDAEKPVVAKVDIGHKVTDRFAEKTNGIAMGAFTESLLNFPSTAHIMGGVPFGLDAEEGVIDLKCEVFNYPGLFVVDGSIMPANPGINPSLTITALAEYAMSRVASREDEATREAIAVRQ